MARSATKPTRFPPPGRKPRATKAAPAKTKTAVRKGNGKLPARIVKALAKAEAAIPAKSTVPSKEGEAFVERITTAQKNTPVTRGVNPLKELEATVKPAPEPKPEAVTTGPTKIARGGRTRQLENVKTGKQPAAAKPAKPTTGGVKFGDAFTRTFVLLLGPHGYKQVASEKPELVVFAKDGTTVQITNPSQPGGSKLAPFAVIRGDKSSTGSGRDALATELGVPQLKRA